MKNIIYVPTAIGSSTEGANYHNDDGGKKPSNVKQELMRTLGTEAIICLLDGEGEGAVVQSDLQCVFLSALS